MCWGREMDGVGLTARRSVRGMPLVMPPGDAAGVVGGRDHAAVGDGKGIVVGRTAGPGGGKTGAELHALDRRNPEKGRCQAVLHAVEHGPAQSGRKPDGGAFDDAAQGVTALAGRQNGGLHPLARRVAEDGEGFCSHCFKKLRCGKKGKGVVCLRAHGGQMRPHKKSPAGQDLLGDAAGDAEGGRQAAGKVAAAPACPPDPAT